jgi:diguanylate cyclase (GGDEF)-like protein
MVFTDECRLEPRTVDRTPRTLLQLLGRDALLARLPGLVADQLIVSVVFLDLDGFKAVNDTLGHTAGDVCLERIVNIVSKIVHGRGNLYRYGGDEFVIALPNFALPNFDCREAEAVAERIRREVETAKAGETVGVTASIGVATSDSVPESAQLVAAADEAAYASKFAGKNRVSVWPLNNDLAAAVRRARETVRPQ